MNLRLRVFWGDRLYVSKIFSPFNRFSIGNSRSDSFFFDIRSWRLFSSPTKTGVTFHKLANLKGYLKHNQATQLFRKMESQPSTVNFSQDDTLYFSLGDTHFYFDWVSSKFPIPKILFSRALVFSGVLLLLLVGIFYFLISDLKLPAPTAKHRKEFSVTLERKPVPPPVILPIPSPAPPVVVEVKPIAPTKIVPKFISKAPLQKITTPQTVVVPPPSQAFDFDQLSEGFGNIPQGASKQKVSKTHRAFGSGEVAKLNAESIGEVSGKGNGKYIIQSIPSATIVNQSSNDGAATFDVRVVDQIVRAHQNQIRFCYEKTLPTSEVEGELLLSFTLNANGKVSSADVSRSPLKNAMVVSCILKQVRSWVFPAHLVSEPVTLQYPIQLSLKK